MSAPRAVLAGGSGFLGQRIAADLTTRGYVVSLVGRRGPDASWDDESRITELIDGSDLVINLAGRSVGCRYTDRNRQEILRSRVETTEAIHRAISVAANPPRLWLNASTATIYRHAMDAPQTEADGELGSGFSVDIARTCEEAFLAGNLPGTRRVALRMAIVLGDGPALTMLLRAARLGLGGPQHEAGGSLIAAIGASAPIRPNPIRRSSTGPTVDSASAGSTSTISWPSWPSCTSTMRSPVRSTSRLRASAPTRN